MNLMQIALIICALAIIAVSIYFIIVIFFQKYECKEGKCEKTFSGTFANKEDCKNQCVTEELEETKKFSCVVGPNNLVSCQPDEDGIYNSLEECKLNCYNTQYVYSYVPYYRPYYGGFRRRGRWGRWGRRYRR